MTSAFLINAEIYEPANRYQRRRLHADYAPVRMARSVTEITVVREHGRSYCGRFLAEALAQTISYVNRAHALMPQGGVPPFVMRFDAGSVHVRFLVFSSETRSFGKMQDLAMNRVVRFWPHSPVSRHHPAVEPFNADVQHACFLV